MKMFNLDVLCNNLRTKQQTTKGKRSKEINHSDNFLNSKGNINIKSQSDKV